MKTVRNILLILTGGLLVAVLGFYLWYLALTAPLKLNEEKLTGAQGAITVYDARDAEIAGIDKNGVKSVAYDDLSKKTVGAFLCAEDKTFFSHHGLNYKRMAAAFFKNAASLSFKEGASTISQQLVKNTQLSQEKTITRKLKEIRLTRQLEKKYEKEEILEKYLNTIYFGHDCFGIASAADYYFGVAPCDLSAAQAATLAGMVRSPNNYSPFRAPEKCLQRRNFILDVMEEEGYLTPAEKENATKEPLPAAPNESGEGLGFYIRQVVDEWSGLSLSPANVYDGVKIYTYCDADLQEYLENRAKQSEKDAAAIVLDAKTGGVCAFYSDIRDGKRPCGSTLKPLLVYAPAIEENFLSPATPILDEKIDYNGYSPRNYDGKYHGYVSAREALANSYNVPAVKILNAVGVKKCTAYTAKMGLPVGAEDESLALALGAMKEGFCLRDLCGAYATFSNGGNYRPTRFIRKIESENGTVLYRENDSSTKVFSEDTTTLLNDMLVTAVKSGTAKKLKNLPYEVCAKTGTHGTKEGNTDAYCVSYTSQNVVGVWLGSAKNIPDRALTGGGEPTNVNKNIQEYLYKNSTPPPLEKSENVAEYTLDKEEYTRNHRLVLCDENAPITEKTYKELFKKSHRPTEQSTAFTRPALSKTTINATKRGILIELCQTQYYSILINRTCDGKMETVYHGKSVNEFLDENVVDGKKYVYSVTPYYGEYVGKTVVLPEILYAKSGS